MAKTGKEAFGKGKNGEEYPRDAWHLHLFAILPQFQGKGFGRKMIEFAEAEVCSPEFKNTIFTSRRLLNRDYFITRH